MLGNNSAIMTQFRSAFIWHLDAHGTTLAQLVDSTGVSRDILNKLKARPGSSTNVESAVKIAGFYGKTVEQFMRCEPSGREREFSSILDRLSKQERDILLAQMRGILQARPAPDE